MAGRASDPTVHLKYRGPMPRLLVLAAALVLAADLPAPFVEMANTERAFAARAAQVGVRDSFLEFFADEAVRFDARPGPAKPALQRAASQPPSVVELVWEPRFGDIAASGELGYLTGPASRIVHADPAPPRAELVYFSIWRRQPDGRFRVVIDQGIATPAAAPFAPGLTRASARDRFTGSPANATETLSQADRANAPPLAADGRLHRDGLLPLVGDAARRRQTDERERRTSPLHADTARSGDLGFTYGTYDNAPGGERGHYVRAWSRTKSGAWRLAVEVTAPTR
jgi:ketosteroid isomerase-like protein